MFIFNKIRLFYHISTQNYFDYLLIKMVEPIPNEDLEEDENDKEKEQKAKNPKFQCRFYERDFPEKNEITMIEIISAEESGAAVRLLEYNNIEGMIQYTEITRKRTNNPKKFAKLGRQEAAVVLNVDEKKKFMDLSKIKIKPEENINCEERFRKSKLAHSVLKKAAILLDIPLITLYQQIGWPLAKKYGHCYDAFKKYAGSGEDIFKDLKIEKNVFDVILNEIKLRFNPRPLKIKSDIEVTCYTFEGIETIKKAFIAGEEKTRNNEFPVKFKHIAPPKYEVVTFSYNKTEGIQSINDAMEVAQKQLVSNKGLLNIKLEPRIIGENLAEEEDVGEFNYRPESASGSEGEGMGRADLEEEKIGKEDNFEDKKEK